MAIMVMLFVEIESLRLRSREGEGYYALDSALRLVTLSTKNNLFILGSFLYLNEASAVHTGF